MRRFWTDREGNIALVFALAAVPIFGAMGVAIDYSMASAYRADIQKSLDATALALTKIMPTDQATLDTVGNQFFQANLNSHNLSNLQLTIQPDVGRLRVSASGTYNVQMANIIGAGTIDLSATAEAKWNIGKVEIALALDNSGSMGSFSRMTHLKEAAQNLLNVLESAAKEPDDAKVAIVPFDSVVNVGTSYVDQPWLWWDEWDSVNGTCSKSQYTSNTTCQNNAGIWTPKAHNNTNWQGCVRDRDQSNDVSDTAPDGTSATRYPAWQCTNTVNSQKLVPMLPLTNNWTTLQNKVTEMTVAGCTNISIGLVWGWHVLSPTELFTEGTAYDTENMTKYIVLMTDGDNTKSRFVDTNCINVTTAQKNAINNRTSTACTNIKNAGVKIYTIRLVSGNATLLQNCASDPSMYYDVQDASELSGVFSAIGSEIASLHLSK